MTKRPPLWLNTILVLSLFFVVASWVTWPTLRSFNSAIPTGDSHLVTVPAFNAWTIWWNATQLERGFEDYWDAPIFAPHDGAFAFSEPQPFTLTVAWVVWLVSLPAAYNSYLFASIILNCVAALVFLQRRCLSWTTSICGAVAVGLHPLAIQNLEAIQLLPVWAIVWALDAAFRFTETLNEKYALQLAIATAITTWICVHHALFTILLLPFVFAAHWFLLKPRAGRFIGVLSMAAVLYCMLTMPLLWTMRGILQEYQFERSMDLVRSLSATLYDWGAVKELGGTFSVSDETMYLSPGVARSALALIAIAFAYRSREATTIGLSTLAVASFLFSFGANLRILDWNFWSAAGELFFPLNYVRSPYRFAYFTQLAVILLAFMQVDQWFASERRRFTEWRTGRLAPILLLLMMTVEVLPTRTLVTRLPTVPEDAAWASVLKRDKSLNSNVLCLPVAKNSSEEAFEMTTRWMILGTFHKNPIRNGYSGFFPSDWTQLREELAQNGLSDSVLDQLSEGHTTYILVKKADFTDDLSHFPQLSKIVEDNYYSLWRLSEPGLVEAVTQ